MEIGNGEEGTGNGETAAGAPSHLIEIFNKCEEIDNSGAQMVCGPFVPPYTNWRRSAARPRASWFSTPFTEMPITEAISA